MTRRRGARGHGSEARSARWATIVLVGLLAALPTAAPTLARFTDATVPAGSFASDTLAPPTSLAASGGTSVSLSWTPTVDTYAAGYAVQRGSASGGPYTTIATVTPRTLAATTDAPATGTWYYVLRSTYQSWTSAVSNQASASVAPAPTTTSYVACTTTAADTTGAGDNNGYQTTPAGACVDGGTLAQDPGSGTGGSQSCGTGATPDPLKDRHRFWGFVTGVPVTASSIVGIDLRADLAMNNTTGSTAICAQLSWDAGATWTTMKSNAMTATAQTTYTFGGAADTWGRTWTAAQLAPSAFRVRLIDAASQTLKRFDLDYVAVRVTYTP